MNTAPGRYCLLTCYCRTCPHYTPHHVTPAERARLLHVLAHPPRKYTPSWWRDPSGRR